MNHLEVGQEGVLEIAEIEGRLEEGNEIAASRVLTPADLEDRKLSRERWRRLDLPKKIVVGLGFLGVEGLPTEGMPETLCRVARASREEKPNVPDTLRGLVASGHIDRVRDDSGKVLVIKLSGLGVEKAMGILDKVQTKRPPTSTR
jgi:hypothetical protein